MGESFLRALRLGTIAVLCAAALAVAGCGGGDSSTTQTAEKGGVLKIGVQGDPESLSPTTSINESAIDIVSQINQSLFTVNTQGKLEPLLATKLEASPDNLTYTVSLRPDVEFSDGKPLTAQDVVFSLNAARKSLYYESFYEPIEKVEAKSKSVVVIKTTRPVAEMEADLSLWVAGIVPNHYGGVSEKQFSQHPIGTGPFMLKSWKGGSSVSLERNPNYWQAGKPLLDEVVFQVIPDGNSRLAQLKGGQADAVVAPQISSLDSLENTPGLTTGPNPLARVDTLQLNLHNKLFKSPRVREAVDLAVDREAIVSAALSGHGQVGGSFLPPVLPFFDEQLKPPAPDIEKAKSLLAAAVKDEGVDPSFTLNAYAAEAYSENASQILQQNLSEIGFNVKIQPLDPASAFEVTANGEYDATISPYYPDAPDPAELVSFVLTSLVGPAGVDTRELTRLAREASEQVDSTKRRELYFKIQEIIDKEDSTIVLDYQPVVWGLSSSVVNFDISPLNVISLTNTGVDR